MAPQSSTRPSFPGGFADAGAGDNGGGGKTIEQLEADLRAAIANEEFEKCAPIRDQIQQLKNVTISTPTLDYAAYEAALANIDASMQAAIDSEHYELCGPLRDKKSHLVGLKGQYDQGATEVLTSLEAAIAAV